MQRVLEEIIRNSGFGHIKFDCKVVGCYHQKMSKQIEDKHNNRDRNVHITDIKRSQSFAIT